MRSLSLKSLAWSALALFVLFPLVALAQAVAPEAPPPTLDQVLLQSGDVVAAFKVSGTLAGMVALVNLLTNLTKVQVVDQLLRRKFWLRPLVSVVLGVLGAVLANIGLGLAWPIAIIGGLLLGLSGGGFHELYTALTNPRVKAERAGGAALVAALEDKAKVDTFKAEIDRVVALPDPKTRLDALIALSNANPPKG